GAFCAATPSAAAATTPCPKRAAGSAKSGTSSAEISSASCDFTVCARRSPSNQKINSPGAQTGRNGTTMGFLGFLGTPLGYVLQWMYDLFGSYGWALIVFTVAVRVLSFPLQIGQQKNTARMAAYRPM